MGSMCCKQKKSSINSRTHLLDQPPLPTSSLFYTNTPNIPITIGYINRIIIYSVHIYNYINRLADYRHTIDKYTDKYTDEITDEYGAIQKFLIYLKNDTTYHVNEHVAPIFIESIYNIDDILKKLLKFFNSHIFTFTIRGRGCVLAIHKKYIKTELIKFDGQIKFPDIDYYIKDNKYLSGLDQYFNITARYKETGGEEFWPDILTDEDFYYQKYTYK